VSYQCSHFKIWELVDKNTHSALGDGAWILFRPDALWTLDKLREHFGQPVVVNNWHEGGSLSYCGFRPYDVTVGARYSQHRLGNGFDAHFSSLTAEEVRQEILKKKDEEDFKLITCLEIDISWVHFDLRNISNRIQLVKP
jgi:hypothetical protein